jgi:ferrous-iron efflux pump FieF
MAVPPPPPHQFRPYNPFDFSGVKPEDATLRASTLSVATAGVMILIKTVALISSGSISVLAALTDSGLDLVSSLVTFFAVRFAKTPPDAEHPFGHGKAEAFSALIQAALVFASAALVGQECLQHFLHPQPLRSGAVAIMALIISIILTFMLITVQSRALKAASSVAITADRAHYATDMASNLIALGGVVLAGFGLAYFDAVAGLIVVAILVWGAIGVLREAADHLMDRGLEPDALMKIRTLAMDDPNVLGIHQMRTRVSGPYVMIQMHMDLDPSQTLEAAHRIIIAAEKRLLTAYPNADIIIHGDPRGLAEPHGGVFPER